MILSSHFYKVIVSYSTQPQKFSARKAFIYCFFRNMTGMQVDVDPAQETF